MSANPLSTWAFNAPTREGPQEQTLLCPALPGNSELAAKQFRVMRTIIGTGALRFPYLWWSAWSLQQQRQQCIASCELLCTSKPEQTVTLRLGEMFLQRAVEDEGNNLMSF